MSRFFSKTTDSRRLVDRFFRMHGLYANLEPTDVIIPGDYGEVHPQSGGFLKDGNILEGGFLERHGLDVGETATLSTETELVLTTDGVKAASANPGVNVAPVAIPVANANFQCSFAFGSQFAGVLVIQKPERSKLTKLGATTLRKLLALPEMKGKALVVDVYSCPAYALVYNTGCRDSVTVEFGATTPTPTGVAVGGQIQMEWSISTKRSQKRSGTTGPYFPLFRLYSARQGLGMLQVRDGRPDNLDEEEPLYIPPWVVDDIDIDDSDEDERDEEEDPEEKDGHGDKGRVTEASQEDN